MCDLIKLAKETEKLINLTAEEMLYAIYEAARRDTVFMVQIYDDTIKLFEPGHFEKIYQEYADAIGKSVDELTSIDKQIAILNYTIDNG